MDTPELVMPRDQLPADWPADCWVDNDEDEGGCGKPVTHAIEGTCTVRPAHHRYFVPVCASHAESVVAKSYPREDEDGDMTVLICKADETCSGIGVMRAWRIA